jgi:uncharacterized membrane protein
MKRLFAILIAVVLCFGFSITAFAGENDEEKQADASTPRLMVTSYEVEKGSISPNKKATVKVTLKNQSSTKAVKNIKLSLSEESGEIKPDGMGTEYVKSIYAGGTYTWQFDLTATPTAQIGEHQVTVNMEYEDKDYNAYSSSDVIRINVKQTVKLDYDGAKLPVKVTQGDTISVDINLMNTGKTDLSNCKLDFDIDNLESGGTTFVGDIPAGENKTGSTNLQISSDTLGEATGTITISYDDAYGKTHSQAIDVSTTIIEKVAQTQSEAEEETTKYPLWWAFLLGGIVVGGGIGCAIPISINARKQRKEDEMRL